MKRCLRCDTEKETSEFGTLRSSPDGLARYCKPCKAAYQREHYAKNQEKWAAYSAKWRTKNKDYKAQKDKEYALAHPERVRKAKAKYKQVHADKVREATARYSAANKELLSKKGREWRKNNPEKHNAKQARRRARLRGNGVFVILEKELRQLMQRPCFYCGKESQHMDHVVPISRGGRHSIGNLVPSCAKCNLSKNDKFLVEWKVS